MLKSPLKQSEKIKQKGRQVPSGDDKEEDAPKRAARLGDVEEQQAIANILNTKNYVYESQ